MELTREEARRIVWDDNEDWETIKTEIYDTNRWSILKSGVFKHLASGKFYEIDWSVGATETQYEMPFEYTDPELSEVEEVEVMTTVWRHVGQDNVRGDK